jgi:hypothetical protein
VTTALASVWAKTCGGYRRIMSTDWAPDACTLPTAERPLRLSEFDDLFAGVGRLDRSSATQLEVVLPQDAEDTARDLAERETACCSFFSFGFDERDRDLVMTIAVPPTYVDVLDALEVRIRPER